MQGLSFVKRGACSFAVGTQTQRVSAPPPPQDLGLMRGGLRRFRTDESKL